ncbi:MAG: efflux RND transporter periplasmic adaptor subunit [Candidatus Moranbacteria bacterium]|nr:efflux RND transporter periplasmic adaptor subunit [Candidatus Moranbacteria bacterium]
MKYKKKIIWLVIIAAVIFSGYKLFAPKAPTTTYTTEDVVKGNLTQTVSVTGELKSDESVGLSFKSSGKIEQMNVEIGDKVTKGQRLAVIEKGVLNEQLRQAQADIKTQKNTLDNMKGNDVYSRDQRVAQKAVVQKFEAARDAVLRQMRDVVMVSPMDGTVVEKKIDLNETAVMNATVLTIANPDNLFVESNIPEADIVKIATEQKALVTFDALTEKDIFTATVVEIDPASTVIQDVVYYRVKLKLDSADARLKIGMSCNVDVLTAQAEDVLMIPQRAVKTEGLRQYVEVLKADGVSVEKVYVETGLSGDNGMVEVLNNLKAGEKVVTFTKTN